MCVAVEAVPVSPISDSKYMSRSSLTPRTPACPLQPNRLLQAVRPRPLEVPPTASPPRPLEASSTTSSPPISRLTNSRPCVTGWSSLCKAYRQTGSNVRSMGLQGSQETLGLCRNRSDQTIDTDRIGLIKQSIQTCMSGAARSVLRATSKVAHRNQRTYRQHLNSSSASVSLSIDCCNRCDI
jgi:hypothetical protein